MAGHVFISHGSDNRDEATALCVLIESRGVTAWMAPRDVRPGYDYSEELQAAIEGCIAFVVLVTETANKSPYVRAETEMAFSGHKPIFPVRLSDIKPAAGLALFLKIRHWTDAYGPAREDNLDRLAAELKTLSVAAAPVAAPAPPTPVPPGPAEQAAPKPSEPLPDEERLAAAIGPNAAWYIERWHLADAKKSSVSWNWPACLVSIYWFAYRKLWLPLAIVAAAFVLLSVLGTIEPRLAQPTFLASIAITFVTGAFGNFWYRRRVRALAADPALDLAALERRGGVSVPAVWITVGLTLLLVFVSAALTVARLPAQPGATAAALGNASGDKPAESGGQAAASDPGAVAPPAPILLDNAYMVGRWTDDGNCGDAIEFLADNRFVAADGAEGFWSLQGSQLTAGGPGGTVTMMVAPVDHDTMTVTNAEGQSSNSTRC